MINYHQKLLIQIHQSQVLVYINQDAYSPIKGTSFWPLVCSIVVILCYNSECIEQIIEREETRQRMAKSRNQEEQLDGWPGKKNNRKHT